VATSYICSKNGQLVAAVYLATSAVKRVDNLKTANGMERDMFDTMTTTKIIGGFCGTFLVFLLGSWAADTIYGAEGGHAEGDAQGYMVEVADASAAPAEAAPEVDFAVVMASADAAAGESVFRNCRSCHSIEDGKNGTGPSLYGVVGRQVDTEAGYSYSGALEAVADIWTPEHLNGFLADPKGYAPGTKMGFKGLKKIEDRANIIAYLDSLDN
jgi:cytochrome c